MNKVTEKSGRKNFLLDFFIQEEILTIFLISNDILITNKNQEEK